MCIFRISEKEKVDCIKDCFSLTPVILFKFNEIVRTLDCSSGDGITIQTYEVRMVMGDDFSDKMFQNPGGYLPGLVIREPQL